MALHEVQLKGYSVRPGNLSLGTFDSYGIEQLHVTADDSWDRLDILAVFHAPNGDAKKVVVGADGMLNVPPEATAKQAGNGRIVFVGLAENVQRITVDMGYNIKTHSDIEGDNPGVPTPDVVQQILGNSNHAVSIATAAQTSAENARRAAEDAAKKAGEESGGAAYSAAAAKKSAEDAAASSKIAADKAEASASSANVANESAEASQTAQGSAESSAQSAAKSARAAADSAASIVEAQEQSAASAYAARNFAQQAKKASDSAAASASESKEAATQAIESNTFAANSAADAEAAKTAAAKSATAAAKSAANANSTANSIKDSMAQIAANKEAVSQLKEDTAALKKRQNVLVGSETGNPASCNDAYSAPLCGLTVYGKSTQDGTPSPDNPVPIVSAGDSGSVAVKMTGANTVEGTKSGNTGSVSGVSYTANKDGISFVGNADTALNIYLHNDIKAKLTPGVYYLTTKGLSTSVSINFYQVGSFNNDVQNREVRVLAGEEYTILLSIAKGANVNGLVVQVSLTRNKITTYSPYREQLLTLPTPNGLPGIPVTSGGNYTDQSGQQWVCDEVDLERGVKVQRVGKRTITTQDTFLKSGLSTNDVNYFSLANFFVHIGTTGKKNALISNRFVTGNNQGFGAAGKIFQGCASGNGIYFSVDAQKYPDAETFKQWAVENGLMFLYQLTDIIETPLTPTEIDAYKALTAYAPNTVVQASDGAGIKLDYQRDVNLVVKNLEDAIASMTTT